MSRRTIKLSDTDKYLKPIHLAGREVTYTITHVGSIRTPSRQRETVHAGEHPEELERSEDLTLLLHFREVSKPLRLTSNGNKDKLFKLFGDEMGDNVIGARVTLGTETQPNFGREYIVVKRVERPAVAPDPTPYRTERLKQLRGLRLTEKEMLTALGKEQKPIAPDEINGMDIDQIERLIARTESNLVDLRAARQES